MKKSDLESEMNKIMHRLSTIFKILVMRGKLTSQQMDAYFNCQFYLYHYCNEKKKKESYIDYG
jgi:phosphoribosylaminoimidazole (AIR) synthetase